MVLSELMKSPDLDRQRSEQHLTLPEFLASYNADLPSSFPRASLPSLKVFRERYPALFKDDGVWSLDQHRKKVMDWLPAYTKSHP